MRGRLTVALGSGLALLATSPALAADIQVKGLDTLVWDKPTVEAEIGDTVTWSFDGTTQAHNVQSSSANWSFASPLGVPAPPYTSEAFTASGTYTFVCQVHPDTMKGTVLVGDAPPPPPPPLSEQPFVNDSAGPGTLETGEYDGTGPSLSSVKARRTGKGARVTFRVSEESRVTAGFVRGGKVRKAVRVKTDGRGTITVRKGLKAGRYRIEVRAEDLAGNRSAKQVRHLTVG